MNTASLDARAITQPGGLYANINEGLLRGLQAWLEHNYREKKADREMTRENRRARRDQFAQSLTLAERLGVAPTAEDSGYLDDRDREAIAQAVQVHQQRKNRERLSNLRQGVETFDDPGPGITLSPQQAAEKDAASQFQEDRNRKALRDRLGDILQRSQVAQAITSADAPIDTQAIKDAGIDPMTTASAYSRNATSRARSSYDKAEDAKLQRQMLLKKIGDIDTDNELKRVEIEGRKRPAVPTGVMSKINELQAASDSGGPFVSSDLTLTKEQIPSFLRSLRRSWGLDGVAPSGIVPGEPVAPGNPAVPGTTSAPTLPTSQIRPGMSSEQIIAAARALPDQPPDRVDGLDFVPRSFMSPSRILSANDQEQAITPEQLRANLARRQNRRAQQVQESAVKSAQQHGVTSQDAANYMKVHGLASFEQAVEALRQLGIPVRP